MKAGFLVLILLMVAQTTSPQIPHSVPPGTEESIRSVQVTNFCESANQKMRNFLVPITSSALLTWSGHFKGRLMEAERATGSIRLCVYRFKLIPGALGMLS
jgi:hypothetical protein